PPPGTRMAPSRVSPAPPGSFLFLPGTGRGTVARSAMVEGPSLRLGPFDPSVSPAASHLPVPGRNEAPACFDNARHHAFKVAENLRGGNAQRSIAFLEQSRVVLGVTLRARREIVRVAVHLDAKPGFQAAEVHRKSPERMLLPELESARPRPQRRPEQPLGRRHLLAQLSRHTDRRLGRRQRPMLHSRRAFLPGMRRTSRSRVFFSAPDLALLPGTGRGTLACGAMVEGSNLDHRPLGPSVGTPRRHLPVPGRVFGLNFGPQLISIAVARCLYEAHI